MEPTELYNRGHFQQAAQIFLESSLKVAGKRQRFPPSESSPFYLQSLAHEADAALCLVRCSESANQEFPALCERALEAYEKYCRELDSITASKIVSWARREKQECAASYLLSTVTISWLHLRLDKADLSSHTLIKGMKWAVSLLKGYDISSVELLTVHKVATTLEQEMPVDHHAFLTAIHAWNVLSLTRNRQLVSIETDDTKECITERDEHSKSAKKADEARTATNELKRRYQIVKALHCHLQVANDPINSSLLQERRNDLLRKASNNELPGDDCSAARLLARRVHLTLQALEALENPKEGCNVTDAALADALCSTLGSSSSFAPFYNLVGCLRMKSSADASLAFRHFERALGAICMTDNHQILHEVVSNIVECFLQLGEPNRALSLLLHLLHEKTAVDATPHAKTLLYLSKPAAPKKDPKNSFLWRIYQAASLATAHATAVAVAEELHSQQGAYSDVAYAHSLLQMDCPSRSLQLCAIEHSICLKNVAFSLYKAEISLSQKARTVQPSSGRLVPSSGGTSIAAIESLVETALNSYTQCYFVDDRVEQKVIDAEIRTILYNNRGIAHVMNGEDEAALICFRRACTTLSSIASPSCVLLLQPFFNLSCLFWKEHRMVEATKVWLPIRGIPLEETGFDLSMLGTLFADALRLFLTSAQLSRCSANGIHIPKSIDEIHVEMVTILDMILMQCGIELANNAFLAQKTESVLEIANHTK